MRYLHGLACVFVAMMGSVSLGCGSAGPAGADGDKGDKGDKGDPGAPGEGTPSVSAVTPTNAYLARTIDVTISGTGTAWSDKATVDFGADIEVNKVTVASASGLVANITIGKAAALGPRDVIVKDDAGGSETFKGVFTISSPIKLTLEGTIAQGSVAFIHGRSLDFTTPFDSTQASDSTYPYIAIPTPMGVSSQVNGVGDFVIDYALLFDVNASTGDQDVDVKSGPKGDLVEFPAPKAYQIGKRDAKDITAGQTTQGTVSASYETSLFKYTPKSPFNFVKVAAASKDANATPKSILLPKSGSFADIIGFSSKHAFATISSDPFYTIYFDNTGYAGYDYTLDIVEMPATDGGNEKEPNNDSASANAAMSLPYVVSGAALSDADPSLLEDWYAIPVTQADVAAGKVIHVITGGDPYTDTVVDVILPDGQTLLGESDDYDYNEDFTSDPVPTAGTYYVRIFDSFFFDPADSKYDMYIALE